ncbi:hypothetical protein OB955_22755 [Halobacteria archaeon AArc-m2/3/4]|uniref:Uncharacterized protein n=1 Tax=Natronoglomus mannanivorans TaxID=2979990 RepID=A0AAP2Z3W7_9EURY|nr:hypothetical protein [Halobacteria archaeon AArc-xg1-1]MCU4975511.1 hypothetical protein [Halobacteria archaeon AArc-m2/3/4]
MVTRLKRVLAVLAVSLLLVSAGCLGGLTGSDGNESANGDDVSESEILSQIEEIETYQFELNQSTETPEGNVTITADGEVDEPNERMYLSMTQEMDVGLGGAIEMEQYVIGDTQYVLMQGVWQQMEVQEDIWEEEGDELSEQGDVIETGELEVVGTETINDVETTVVRVDGTDELIDDLEADVEEDAQQQQMQSEVAIDNVTYHFYVDEETHTLHRTEMEMSMEENGQSVQTSMEMTFFEHNEPVDIELPEAAEDAEEIDDDAMGDPA